MKYNISKSTPPGMPNLGRGTECVQLLLSQTSKDMHQSLVPILFPALGAHISGAEFMYPDRSWKEMCGMMGAIWWPKAAQARDSCRDSRTLVVQQESMRKSYSQQGRKTSPTGEIFSARFSRQNAQPLSYRETFHASGSYSVKEQDEGEAIGSSVI